MESVAVSDVASVPVRMFTGDDGVALKRCNCCELEWPVKTHFSVQACRNRLATGRAPQVHSYCRACDGGGALKRPKARKRKGEVTTSWCQQNAIEWFARRNLGLPTRDLSQSDISVEAYKIGAEPGHVHAPSPASEPPTADQVAARRQERFEAAQATPRPPRQQRRARERRIIKDARMAVTRPLSEAEVVQRAIDRSITAKRRARGGTRTTTRKQKTVEWNLEPIAVSNLIKSQGYRCALSGEAFKESTEYGSSDPFGPSPNRIDPGGPYTIENCEYVCWWVNRLINDMPRQKALQFLADRKLLKGAMRQMVLLPESPTDVVSTTGGDG